MAPRLTSRSWSRRPCGKRGWLNREHFLDLLAATNLVPGPNATEMAIHIGFVRAGWPGFIAGGVAFIVPAFTISLALAIVYVRVGSLPQVASLFYGINPAVLAIILAATYRLGRTALKDRHTVAIAAVSLAAALAGINEVVVVAVGLAGIVLYTQPWRSRTPPAMALLAWSPLALPILPAVALAGRPPGAVGALLPEGRCAALRQRHGALRLHPARRGQWLRLADAAAVAGCHRRRADDTWPRAVDRPSSAT